jgi:hypothetical protein
MNIKENGSNIGWVILAFFMTMTALSCKKTGPTRAIITVIDSTSAPVSGAKVTLWQDTVVNVSNGVQSHLRITKLSDAAGRAEFDFQLEAFLNVEASKSSDTGRSFIRLKEHETVSQTVAL